MQKEFCLGLHDESKKIPHAWKKNNRFFKKVVENFNPCAFSKKKKMHGSLSGEHSLKVKRP